MTVSAILKEKGRTILTITAAASLGEAVTQLATHRIGAIIVADAALQYRSEADNGHYSVDAVLRVNGIERQAGGEGNGPLSAFVDALGAAGYPVRVLDYSEHALSSGGDALAAAYVEVEIGEGDDARVLWGVGRHSSIVTASMKAVLSAINRSDRTD